MSEGPYTVQIDKPGCDHCGAGRLYSVVFHNEQADELAESTLYSDYDEAEGLAERLNQVYDAGRESMREESANAHDRLGGEE